MSVEFVMKVFIGCSKILLMMIVNRLVLGGWCSDGELLSFIFYSVEKRMNEC